MLIYRMLYISLIVITDQKSITDSQRKEKKFKHNAKDTKDNHQITRDQSKRRIKV